MASFRYSAPVRDFQIIMYDDDVVLVTAPLDLLNMYGDPVLCSTICPCLCALCSCPAEGFAESTFM